MAPVKKRFRRRRTLLPGWVFLISIALGLLASWNTGNNLLYIVVGGLASFVLMSVVLARWNIRRMQVSREGPQAVHRGDESRVAVRIENHKLIMPAVSLRIESASRPGESAAYIPKVPPRRAAMVHMTEVFEKRGIHMLPEVTFVSAFPFGLFERRFRVRDAVAVVVYPRVVSVRASVLEQLPGASNVPKMAVGDGTEFFSLREYVPGDDVRRIVWRASARLGRLVVKELVWETCRSVAFVLDTHLRPDVPGFGDRFEEAIELVASLAVTLLNQQYTVSIVTPTSHLSPGEGKPQVHKVLEMLARLKPAHKLAPGGFGWFASAKYVDGASHMFVSPDPREWGQRTFLGGRILDPREVIRA